MKRVRITLDLSGEAASLLRSLVASGLFGKDEGEAAQRLVLEQLRKLFPKAVR